MRSKRCALAGSFPGTSGAKLFLLSGVQPGDGTLTLKGYYSAFFAFRLKKGEYIYWERATKGLLALRLKKGDDIFSAKGPPKDRTKQERKSPNKTNQTLGHLACSPPFDFSP